MSTVLQDIFSRAKVAHKKVVLTEGEDKRVVLGAVNAGKQGLADVIVLGNAEQIKANNADLDLSVITIIDPVSFDKTDLYAQMLFKAREGKINKKTGLPEYADVESAKKSILKDYAMYGALMLKNGDADGMVSGACHSTANTLRPGLQVIKTAPNINTVSSCFIMVAPDTGCAYAPDNVAVFADCAINIEPDANQLKDIALSTAQTAQKIAGIEPRIAMLSFSTMGSGNDDKYFQTVPKMQQATALVKEADPSLKVDGEFQFDAAVAPEVASIKAPNSSVAGKANVFIFPNINAGNIGYKIAQRFGGFMALGPICQGFAKPINDLSRGCNADDVMAVVAVTSLQAE